MSAAELEPIAEIREAGLIRWRQLPAGLCNRSFLVVTGRGRWVVRLNGDVPGVDRELEARVLEVVAGSGMGPPLIACEPRKGYLISEYLEEPTWTRERLSAPSGLDDLARRLRLLHHLQVDAAALDVRSLVADYFAQTGLVTKPTLVEAGQRLLLELGERGYFERQPGLCHHDLHASNIIGRTQIRFLDWEFARPGHPDLDLGFVIQYHDLLPDEAAALVAAYYGSPAKDALVGVSLAVRLAQLLELLWLTARGQQGPLAVRAQRRLRRLMLVWS